MSHLPEEEQAGMANDLQADKDRAARQALNEQKAADARHEAEVLARQRNPSPFTLREQAVGERRIAEEKAAHERGGPVAGHDWEEERQQRQGRRR